MERIWKPEGLKVSANQTRMRLLWLNDGSRIRQRPEKTNHVRAYGFVHIKVRDGRPVRLLTSIVWYTR